MSSVAPPDSGFPSFPRAAAAEGADAGAEGPPGLAPPLAEVLDRLPHAPGVYLFKDRAGAVFYVGKAKNLFARVRQYFSPGSSDTRVWVPFLAAEVGAIDWVVTPTEKDALILENTFIKQHRPRCNVDLKDDKTYLSLRLDQRHEFPRLSEARAFQRDGAMYFGPYTSASAARQTLKLLGTVFGLRRCTDYELAHAPRPCVYYDLGCCSAPCAQQISAADYAEQVKGAVLFLTGKSKDLIRTIDEAMRQAARELRFEDAARLRDQRRALEETARRQTVVSPRFEDWDVFACCPQGDATEVQHLPVRQGQLAGSKAFTLPFAGPPEELLQHFLQQFYVGESFFPPVVLLDREIPDRPLLEEWLSDRRGKAVTIAVPRRGTRRALVQLAARNAEEAARRRRDLSERQRALLVALQGALGLKRLPRRLECFDISHVQGTATMGAMAVFQDGLPARREYRHYRVRFAGEEGGGDDFRALEEVLTRRLERALDAGVFPDLLVIDGGAAQVARVQGVLERMQIEHHAVLDLIGLAKARTKPRAGGGLRFTLERVFPAGRETPVILDPHAPELHLLARARDEAHRFAVMAHRRRRRKEMFATGLEGLPGLGPKRRAALLARFRTLAALRDADPATLAECPGISPALAAAVYRHLHAERVSPDPGAAGDT